jgi:hypothetical protein
VVANVSKHGAITAENRDEIRIRLARAARKFRGKLNRARILHVRLHEAAESIQ